LASAATSCIAADDIVACNASGESNDIVNIL
jgi:hypothetical protein